MEVHRHGKRIARNVAVGLLPALVAQPNAHAFNSMTHMQITQSAFAYLANHPHLSTATDAWTTGLGSNYGFMRELLARTVVDADFRTDQWMGAWFHAPFVGAKGMVVNYFTTFSHHLNVTIPGSFWKYDGYAYRNTGGTGNDGYLDMPTLTVDGSLSSAFGGFNPDHPGHGFAIGPSMRGFQGTQAQWQGMFYGGSASDAVFPPANVPAQLAYETLMNTPRSTVTFTDSWDETVPVVDGIFTSTEWTRPTWRAEIAGLPRGFDLLGLVLHLVQDMGMPHHAEGTADFCHPELEKQIDAWACGHDVDQGVYDAGDFDASAAGCQNLYDPALVQSILLQWRALDPNAPMSISDRMVQYALISARWVWGTPTQSLDNYATLLPNGQVYSSDSCSTFMDKQAVYQQARYQYNLAVAASVTVFESVARDYDAAHPLSLATRFVRAIRAPAALMQLFQP